jgi:putative CocE/NonD family hydrolase
MMAPDAPDALGCQFVIVAAPDLYRHAIFQGGVLRKSLIEGWLRLQGSEFLLEGFAAHPFEDSFWDAVDISGRYGQVDVPALHVGGWYDIFAQGTLDAFVGYEEQGGVGAAGQQHLIMGPWTHAGLGGRVQGELEYPQNAEMDLIQLTSDWSEECLLGEEGTASDWPAVCYYVMGDVDDANAPGNVWREAEAWPTSAKELRLYLRGGGKLDAVPPTADEGGDTFLYDPSDPSPTVCGANLLRKAGPCDQGEVEVRDDALVYTTPPLEEPLEVTGRVRARLWLVSDAPDTDVAVRLTDVYPDGRSMLVLDGILRARFRGLDFSREELMTPGTPYELEIDVGSTSIIFNAGHSVRIIVSSSNAPRFDPNPNTGALYGASTETRLAANTILHNADHSSVLLLPVPEQ